MSGARCPGQDGRELTTTVVPCPACGAEVEMFSDETRAKCPKCRQWVYKEETPSCVQWCAKARECVGEERWQQLQQGKRSQ
jgi:NADH pyrophosphatase NudC (nudix superfamily)